MNGVQLSDHFWLHEFTRSDYAARIGREISPSEMEVENLRRLCITVLEPIRVRLDRVMFITSGLRPEWLNTAIGGSSHSDHVTGCAADFIVQGLTPRQVCETIAEMEIYWHQLIMEFDRWVHISVPMLRVIPARQVLTARRLNGSTSYLPGLV